MIYGHCGTRPSAIITEYFPHLKRQETKTKPLDARKLACWTWLKRSAESFGYYKVWLLNFPTNLRSIERRLSAKLIESRKEAALTWLRDYSETRGKPFQKRFRVEIQFTDQTRKTRTEVSNKARVFHNSRDAVPNALKLSRFFAWLLIVVLRWHLDHLNAPPVYRVI